MSDVAAEDPVTGALSAPPTVAREGVPLAWPAPDARLLQRAREAALAALANVGPRPVRERLVRYYDVAGNYAGASFAQLAPLDRETVTAIDLHAVQLLAVKIGPGATRRLLNPGAARERVLQTLQALPDVTLSEAGPGDLAAMEPFHLAVKAALSHRGGATRIRGSPRQNCAPASVQTCSRCVTRRCAPTSG